MSILDGIKKVVTKIKDTVSPDEQQQKLEKWKQKFINAKQNWDSSIFDERELLYNGTHDVDANINATDAERSNRRKANNVVNIIYEFIEAQVDTTIPQPSVKSKRPQWQQLAKDVEDSAKNDLLEMEVESINDENERTTPIQGFSIITVAWNPDKIHHLHRGEIELDAPHPKQLIPQPGVYKLQKMDYFFLLYSMTKGQVKEIYNKEIPRSESEQYPEINYFHEGQVSITGENDKVTVIVCWYLKDGVKGKFVWCNETVLQDLPNFYARRLQRCTRCGEVKGDTEECQGVISMPSMDPMMPEPIEMTCGNKKYKESIEETEVLTEDVHLPDGMVIPAGTEVPYFQPTKYPVVLRRNVPVNFQLGGQSDVDIIRDQADAIKKVVSRLEEKIIRGGSIVTALDDHRFNLTNELFQVIRGSQAQLQALSVKNLTSDIQAELAVAQYMYKAAQDTLGVTNSWMGKEDKTADSGVAKQIQVQQSSGRMQSKLFNKYAAFKELFEIMFEFKLAYYDELRPYMRRDQMGNVDWGGFSKYNFLAMDADGQWYYNTDFLFEATMGDGFPKDRMWMSQKAQELFQASAMDPVGLWTVLESLNFPMATTLKEMAVQQKQEASQVEQMKAQIDQLTAQNQQLTQTQQMQPQQPQGAPQQGLPPEFQEILQQLPPEAQQIMPPEEQMAFFQQDPEQIAAVIEQMVGGGQVV